MMRRGKDRTGVFWLWLSVGGFLFMSISFLLMPIETPFYLPSVFLWGGLAVGAISQVVLEMRRRKFFAAYNVDRQKMQKPRNGFLTFGSNRVAMLADIVLTVSVVATVLVIFFTKGYGYLCYVCVAMLLFFFCLHCIFNGRNYFHVNNQDKIQQVLENKKASITEKERERNENS